MPTTTLRVSELEIFGLEVVGDSGLPWDRLEA